jgi:hypothetical protein
VKVGDLIRPSPHYRYEESQWGGAFYIRSNAPPCVVTKIYKAGGKVVYVKFHCSWNNKFLIMENPIDSEWCEVVSESW